MKEILILNGPNLKNIGKREPDIYGENSLVEYLESLKYAYNEFLIKTPFLNTEGEIIDEIENSKASWIIINAGAYTHTSIAIRDALASKKAKILEVHISNIFSREDFRKKSYISDIAVGIISGFELEGYKLCLDFILKKETA